jgi:hypothetical protein
MPWDPSESFARIAAQAQDADFGQEWAFLREMSEELLQSCWRAVDGAVPDVDAGHILIHHARAGYELTEEVTELVSLAQLINAAHAHKKLCGDAGHELVTALDRRLWTAMAERHVSPDDYRADAMSAIEKALFGMDRTATEVLTGGLVMLGRRAVGLRDPKLALLATAYGLRAVYAFYRTQQKAQGDATLARCAEELAGAKTTLDRAALLAYGMFLLAAAGGAELGGYRDERLALLKLANEYLPADTEQSAECLWKLGQESEKAGDLVGALEKYEQAFGVTAAMDERLRHLIATSVSNLRAELEGAPTKLIDSVMGLARAFGDDPASLEPLRRIITQARAQQSRVGEDDADAANAIGAMIDVCLRIKAPDNTILALYNLMLKTLLRSRRPSALQLMPHLIAKAETHLSGAAPATILDFELLRDHCATQEDQ